MWIIFAAAVVPGLLLLYYVYSKDFNPVFSHIVYNKTEGSNIKTRK